MSKTTKYVLFPAGSLELQSEDDLPCVVEVTGYRDIQKHIGGTFTGVYARGSNLTFYAHDEGLIIGLPWNPWALLVADQTIVGPLLVGGRVDSEGNVDSVPQTFIDQWVTKPRELYDERARRAQRAEETAA